MTHGSEEGLFEDFSVTSDGSIDIKEIHFLVSAAKDYEELPDLVAEKMTEAITQVQNNQKVAASRRTDLSGNLKGISEFRVPFSTNTYRTYFAAEYDEVVFILDVGMKKSPKGGEIPKDQKQMLIDRKKAADALYNSQRSNFQDRYKAREARRVALETPPELGPTRGYRPK